MSLPKSNHCKDNGENAKDDVGSYFGVVGGSCRRYRGCRAGRNEWLFSLADDERHSGFERKGNDDTGENMFGLDLRELLYGACLAEAEVKVFLKLEVSQAALLCCFMKTTIHPTHFARLLGLQADRAG